MTACAPPRLNTVLTEPLAVQHKVREEQSSLASREGVLEPLAVPFDLQAIAQVHSRPIAAS